MVIDWRCALVNYPGEVMTDMDYSIYPAGFYTVRFFLITTRCTSVCVCHAVCVHLRCAIMHGAIMRNHHKVTPPCMMPKCQHCMSADRQRKVLNGGVRLKGYLTWQRVTISQAPWIGRP